MMAKPEPKGLNRYNDLYLWMFIPMAIMQIGIFYDYWGDFSDNGWPVHVHYWTASLWYLFLILNPYFAAKRQFEHHRTFGIVGFFLAGGVAMTAFSALNRDTSNAVLASQTPGRFGFFDAWFFYGIAAVEFVMMSAFVFAIVQAIRFRRSLHDHAWWLISTVFIIMMPSVGRGIGVAWPLIFGRDDPRVTTWPLYLTTVLIIALLLWASRRYGRTNHPATWLAVGVNLFNLLLEPLGKWQWMQNLLAEAIKT